MILAAPMMMLGCSNNGAERICDPGTTQLCMCTAVDQGVQVCSDDGTRWGDCNCGVPDAMTDVDAVDVADDGTVPVDGDAADEAGCEDSCGPEGAAACAGNDLENCQRGANGCLAWAIVQRCLDTGLLCTEEGGRPGCREAPGNCSLDGAPCIDDADCPNATIRGFCFDLPYDATAGAVQP